MQINQLKCDRLKYEPGTTVAPEIQAFLSGQPISRVERLKERTKRSVFIIYAESDSDQPAYFLKYDHPVKLQDRLKGHLRPKVQKEYKITRRLFDMNVPVVEPVLCAWAGSQGIFVSKAIPGAVSFGNRWLKIKDDPAVRQAFLKEWRRLLVVMLENNLYHADFHSGNILTIKKGETFRFSLVDVVDVRICLQLSEKQTLQSLKIVTDWGHWLTDKELSVLLQGLPGLFHQVEYKTIQQKLTCSAVQQFYRKGLRHLRQRVLERESLVHIVEEDDGTFWINQKSALTASRARGIIGARQSSGAGQAHPDGAVLSDGTVQHCCVVANGRGCWVISEYSNICRWKKRSCSPDVRGWFNLWGLQAAGLSVPQPQVLFRTKDGAGFIITEFMEGVSLADLLADADEHTETFLFQLLYNYMRDLYTWKIFSRQLRPADFIVTVDNKLVLLSWDNFNFNTLLSRNWEWYTQPICRGMHQAGSERFKCWLEKAGDITNGHRDQAAG